MEGVGFTEINPDKGTETSRKYQACIQNRKGLQKLTPIRGRKQTQDKLSDGNGLEFTEINPDKGTETRLAHLP